jgi:hypothetical protein
MTKKKQDKKYRPAWFWVPGYYEKKGKKKVYVRPHFKHVGKKASEAKHKKIPYSPYAIAGFILSFWGIIALLGLIFSFLGIWETRRNLKRGRELAVAGLVVSIIVLASMLAAFPIPGTPVIREFVGILVPVMTDATIYDVIISPADLSEDWGLGEIAEITHDPDVTRGLNEAGKRTAAMADSVHAYGLDNVVYKFNTIEAAEQYYKDRLEWQKWDKARTEFQEEPTDLGDEAWAYSEHLGNETSGVGIIFRRAVFVVELYYQKRPDYNFEKSFAFDMAEKLNNKLDDYFPKKIHYIYPLYKDR